jgi:hypothetical protein
MLQHPARSDTASRTVHLGQYNGFLCGWVKHHQAALGETLKAQHSTAKSFGHQWLRRHNQHVVAVHMLMPANWQI